MRTRAYTDADLPAVQASLAQWIATAGECGYCHVGDLPHRIYGYLRGKVPVAEAVRLWFDDDAIVGIAISALFGAAFDVFAAPHLRGTDAETAMLIAAAEVTALYKAGTGDPWILTDVQACDEVRAALLRGLGFERYRTWDHIAERRLDPSVILPGAPDGFTVRRATMEDFAELARARNASFDADWTALQYRDEVMRKPGYDPGREIVAETDDGRIAAYAVIWFDDVNGIGLFEPVGTDPAFQRRGLARAIMAEGLHAMLAAGMARARVEYDATNEAAAALYASMGFVKRHETLGYRRVR